MSAERELAQHGMHLPDIGRAAGLVHLRICAISTLESTLKLILAKVKVLVVVLAGAHGAATKVVE